MRRGVLGLGQQSYRRNSRELPDHCSYACGVLGAISRDRDQDQTRFLFPEIGKNFLERFPMKSVA
jgi:hypothetical protein